jgi:hypothetical protein
MESQSRHILLVYADGVPGSLMKSRMVLSWARADRPYSVWSLPGPIWVGQWAGTDLSGEGLPLTLEPGRLRIFEISETL